MLSIYLFVFFFHVNQWSLKIKDSQDLPLIIFLGNKKKQYSIEEEEAKSTQVFVQTQSVSKPMSRRGGVLPILGRRGCADYMGGFFLGAKYVDMGIWNLYLWV